MMLRVMKEAHAAGFNYATAAIEDTYYLKDFPLFSGIRERR
jgi:hypothetical protein